MDGGSWREMGDGWVLCGRGEEGSGQPIGY
jgi:hypothetical protein